MQFSKVRFLLQVLCVLLCCRVFAQAPSGPPAAATKSALLIGIDNYSHPTNDVTVPDGAPRIGRYEPLLIYRDLKGPSHDVAAMRDLLTSEKFGFPNDDKHIHILLDQAATRDAILKAMQQYLVKDPSPGDTVVLFISSHGSLRADPNADPKRHCQRYDLDGTGLHSSCVENTIVPYDWYLGQDDIFSRDLRHIFNQAADRGIHLTAIFDSCHSGSLARGAESTALVARDFDFDPRPMPDDPYPAEVAGTPPESRQDNPVLVLSAAQKDQSAIDVQNGDPPHGLFTDALALIDRKLRFTPDDPAWLFSRGYVSIKAKAYDDAIDAFTRVLAIKTNNPPALFNRALACLDSGKLDAARADYKTLQQSFTNSFQVAYGLGEIAWRKHETNEAIRNYKLYLANANTNTAEATNVIQRLRELKGHSP